MTRKTGLLLSTGLVVVGISLLVWLVMQPVNILVNGASLQFRTTAFTVGNILQQAGIPLHTSDLVLPGLDTVYLSTSPIRVQTNTPITISLDGKSFSTYSTQQFPANILGQLGIRIFPGDHIRVDGRVQSSWLPFSHRTSHTIQVIKARTVQIAERTVLSSAESIGQIWWENGLHRAGFSLPQSSSGAYLPAGGTLELTPITTILLRQNKVDYSLEATGSGVDQQLASTGFAPQGLDTIAVEPSGQVLIKRTSDRMEMSPKSIGYTTQTRLEDSLALDEQQVIQAGEYGLSLQLTRIRTQDGEETSRDVESETILKHPQDEITGYGTRIDVQTIQVGGGSIEYYRALSLYATSYSPCRSGGSKCSTGTASGEPARKGIVAVIPAWYAYMSGQQVYIPGYGYGVIGDTGGGIPGTNWIDLGYNDDDYVSWHSWVTVYFLTPVPANILYTLQ